MKNRFNKFPTTLQNTPNLISRFFTYKNIEDLLTSLQTQFSITRVTEIGKSSQHLPLHLLTLGINIPSNEHQSPPSNPPSIFLDSVHHAREVLGVTMNVYTTFNLLYNYVHKDKGVTSLLRSHNIYILFLVNPDGYKIISDQWEKSHIFKYIRKNRKEEGTKCSFDTKGVDLNRNYGYKWGMDNIGSSNGH